MPFPDTSRRIRMLQGPRQLGGLAAADGDVAPPWSWGRPFCSLSCPPVGGVVAGAPRFSHYRISDQHGHFRDEEFAK